MKTKPTKLFKTTVIIWTEADPRGWDMMDLGYAADRADGFCSSKQVEAVTDPSQFPETDFFNGSENNG
jgi:hypothetical protein